jgi:hypothetical protein
MPLGFGPPVGGWVNLERVFAVVDTERALIHFAEGLHFASLRSGHAFRPFFGLGRNGSPAFFGNDRIGGVPGDQCVTGVVRNDLFTFDSERHISETGVGDFPRGAYMSESTGTVKAVIPIFPKPGDVFTYPDLWVEKFVLGEKGFKFVAELPDVFGRVGRKSLNVDGNIARKDVYFDVVRKGFELEELFSEVVRALHGGELLDILLGFGDLLLEEVDPEGVAS